MLLHSREEGRTLLGNLQVDSHVVAGRAGVSAQARAKVVWRDESLREGSTVGIQAHHMKLLSIKAKVVLLPCTLGSHAWIVSQRNYL